MNFRGMLGVNSYETAWSWLHKLRRAMVRPDREKLCGIVEIDETYVGGEEEGARGRYTEKKAIVVIAVELENRGYGRVRLRCVPNVRRDSLESFVQEEVAAGTILRTDGGSAYKGIGRLGYIHNVADAKRIANAIEARTLRRFATSVEQQDIQVHLRKGEQTWVGGLQPYGVNGGAGWVDISGPWRDDNEEDSEGGYRIHRH